LNPVNVNAKKLIKFMVMKLQVAVDVDIGTNLFFSFI